jgi:hypothetical protein
VTDLTNPNVPRSGVDGGKLAMGVLLVAFGFVFLADRYFWVDAHEAFRLWPLLLIAYGAVKVAFPGGGRCGRGSRLSGFWPLLIGGIFLADMLDVMTLHDSWPLFIVGIGVVMVLRAMGAGRSTRQAGN